VPLLFAATLFVSASLLFMVQPMVGKMVLPLLGGSPAVWNACMVFFQALLLLGSLYAHHVSGKFQPREQWLIHTIVLGLPLAAFLVAVMFGSRHSPIAIAESLAPGGDSSPVLSVLLLLTVAIGVPFFVVSTSAPLLQKWFTCTGHPSARDPYFLYAASNFGSMISLLGYPLFIEPYLTITEQAWVFAFGFAFLAVLVALCGHAAANPLGVPPSAAKLPANRVLQKAALPNGQQSDANKPAFPSSGEPPPAIMRKLKWITLAFVPSSLMLGVTFYMTTDIASIPLLWVGPLALYLITFIIAFGRVPNWFRIVIGNLAPVMVLLLVFVLLSNVPVGIGLLLFLHLITFFAAALMCHYELARDRPSPKYLTEFFLLMSVGGVLGGIFNSLLAPLIFPHAYEYRIVLVLACLLVPRLTDSEDSTEDEDEENPRHEAESKKGSAAMGKQTENARTGRMTPELRQKISLALDVLIPVAIGVGFYFLEQLPGADWFRGMRKSISDSISVSQVTIQLILIYAVPVMLCFFFVDRPLRFALCVAAILAYPTYREEGSDSAYSERSFFGILKVQKVEEKQRPNFVLEYCLTDQAIAALQSAGVTETVLSKLRPLKDAKFSSGVFTKEIEKRLTSEEVQQWNGLIAQLTRMSTPEEVYSGEIVYHRLVHGTTLHGTQIYEMKNNVFDMFQALTALNPLENLVVACANHEFDPRQEPLTYYHRTGPVGAMFHELRTRKGGADAKARYAMVGLGTGSASCYALPGQKITFYEIDPAVKHLVADTDKYFTYVRDARNRGAELDIRMGDARLKLKEDTDRKYALLLVDAFSSDSIPVHLLTKEAVQLYFDRMTEDGLLALHISNKFVRLEPVVGAIARDLGVTARVWSDDNERRGPGKTASSWVVLARTPAQLGSLYTPLGDLPFPLELDSNQDMRQQYTATTMSDGSRVARSFMESPFTACLASEYSDDLEKKSGGNGKDKRTELNEASSPREAWLGWLQEKMKQVSDPQEKERLALYDQLIRDYGFNSEIHDVMMKKYGHAFRRLEVYRQVEAWTDDYSDVMRVMMIPELQAIRKFFGLPTPIER
jgi:hypothetical protein